ncbi:MAG: hypothetical protein ABJ251_06090 [Paracoccaceae bacterium]
MNLNDYVVRGDASAIQMGVLSARADASVAAQALASVAAPALAWVDAFKSGRMTRSIQVSRRSNHDMAPFNGCQTQNEKSVTVSSTPIIQWVSTNPKKGTCKTDLSGETPQIDEVDQRNKQELRCGPVRPQPHPNNLSAARTKN